MLKTEFTSAFSLLKGLISLSSVLLWSSSPVLGSPDFGKNSIRLETHRTHSRLVFFVERNVKTTIKVDTKKFELRAKDITLADLGIPFGKENEVQSFYRSLKDNRINGLRVFEDKDELVFQGEWRFPTGDKELYRPSMEFFDYRDTMADQLVLDFWVKPGPTVAEVQRKQEIIEKKRVVQAQKSKIRRRSERRIATINRRKKAEEILGFCEKPLDKKTDLFLQIESFHEDIDFDRIIGLSRPDQDYAYLIPRSKSEEADYVRLAVKLYGQSKSALAIRAVDFMDRDYPESPYKDEMVFLKANALLKLGLIRKGEELLKETVTLRREHPSALFAAMYLAKQRLAKKEYLAALNHFLWLINNNPRHELIWLYHLGAAESLFRLKQTQRAAAEYQWIVKNVDDLRIKGDAAARIGDLFMDRGGYEQALAAYYKASKYFPEQSKRSATLQINRAEALFQLGQFDRARKVFEKFLVRFKIHPEGWRAAYRLAVIYGQKEARSSNGNYRKYLYKSINDFPASPAATLARLRLAACGDHGGFDFRSMTSFFSSEALKFNPVDQVKLAGYEDLRNLEEARAAMSLGEEWYAVEISSRELGRRIGPVARQQFEGMFVDGFRAELKHRLNAGEKYSALSFYSRYRDTFSSIKKKRVLTEFMLELARGASDLGLGRLAQQIIKTYRGTGLHRSVASQGDEPLTEDLMLESEEAFTEALAVWTEHGAKQEDEVRDLLKKVSDESPLAFEKQLLLSRMAEKEEDYSRAVAEMIKAKTLAEKYRLALIARVDYHLVQLYVKAGRVDPAIILIGNIEGSVGVPDRRSPASIRIDLPTVPSETDLLAEEARLLEGASRWSAVVGVYRKAVKRGLQTTRVQYLLARALMKTGKKRDKKEAIKVLESVSAQDGTGFWKKMVINTLESEKAKEGEK